MIYDCRIYQAPTSAEMPTVIRVIGEFMGTFEKHGMRVVGVWTPVVSDNNLTVHYILEYRDLSHWEEAWNSYKADAGDQNAFVESFGGKFTWLELVSTYLMEPTSFSPLGHQL
jgi:hypothetical protein